MYKVKNITKDPRKFQDRGMSIIVNPGEEVATMNPPIKSDIFEVREIKGKKEVTE